MGFLRWGKGLYRVFFRIFALYLYIIYAMLSRDYFLRIIQEFAVALSLFLEKKVGEDKRDQELKELYAQYVGPYEVLRNLSWEETLAYAEEQWDEEQRVDRLEMLAFLLDAEAGYKALPLRELLLGKAFRLLDYVDAHSSTFSLNRKMKLSALWRALEREEG